MSNSWYGQWRQNRVLHPEEYARYLHAEWDLFHHNPCRARMSLDAIGQLSVARVLDVGCGAAQELLPFVTGRDVLGLGIDKSSVAASVAHQLFGDRTLRGRVAFATALAEQLPCKSDSFDVVICRLTLPYTENAQALSEMARVVRSGGLILLQFHHPRFYVTELARAVKTFDLAAAVHNVIVLMAGAVYFLTGRQPRARFVAGEVFQTEQSLRQKLSRHGLEIGASLPNSNRQTPSLILRKK